MPYSRSYRRMGGSYDRCVTAVKRKRRSVNAYAVCTSAFQKKYGKRKVSAMRKSVRRRNPGERDVRISEALQERLSQWHAGQGDPIYAVASSAYAGRPVSLELAERAANSLARAESQLLDNLREYENRGQRSYVKSTKTNLKHLLRTRLMLDAAIMA